MGNCLIIPGKKQKQQEYVLAYTFASIPNTQLVAQSTFTELL